MDVQVKVGKGLARGALEGWARWRAVLFALSVAAVAVGCDDGGAGPTDVTDAADVEVDTTPNPPSLLEDPTGPFPDRMSEVGLYLDLPARDATAPRAIGYAPRYPLWSNGSAKERHVVLPEGEVVDTSDRARWTYPAGTLFFKTFTYPDGAAPGGERPVETRVIRRGDAGWDFTVYQWNDGGTDATRLSLDAPVPVAVSTPAAGAFEHQIPSALECRSCHEADPRFIIGFDELQLGGALPGASRTQLEALDDAGLWSRPAPDDPATIEADDALTREVIGVVQGNCAHCHNGSATALGQFDLRHDAFIEQTVGVPADRWAGLRVAPGAPEESALYLAITGGGPEGPAPMPPLGVQVRDEAAAELVRTWIEGLPAGD